MIIWIVFRVLPLDIFKKLKVKPVCYLVV